MAAEPEKLHGIRVNAKVSIEYVPLDGDTVVIWDGNNPKQTPDKYVQDSVVQEVQSALDGDNLNAGELLKLIRQHHEGVDEEWYNRAVSLVVMPSPRSTNDGEMILQQTMYAPFSNLLCSMNVNGYLADQTWTSPIQVIVNDVYKDVIVQPDAASTHSGSGGLTDTKAIIGDVLTGVLEIKSHVKANTAHRLHMGDIAKCILATSCSALLMLRYGVPWEDIAVPFLVACGRTMLLAVAKVNENGHPWCKTIFEGVTRTDDKRERLSTFACFALLVAKQHGAAKKINTKLADEVMDEQARRDAEPSEGDGNNESTVVKTVGLFTPSAAKKRRTSSSTSNNTTRNSKTTGSKSNKCSSEAMAKQIASFDGEIVGLRSMKPPPKLIIDDDFFDHFSDKVPDTTISPFYFQGHLAKSEKDKVFCKVWRQGDPLTPPAETVQEEIRMIQLAYQHGVPVPKPWSEFSGTNLSAAEDTDTLFHVVVLSFLNSKAVALADLGHYALSLVKAVRALHDRCSVLHCDLKPSNVLWVPSTQQVYLADFGHAQLLQGATGYRATKSFEAPEIAAGEPHSRASDAYGVGVTILAEIDRLQIRRSHWLCDVATQLSATETCDRIALSEAESLIEGALRPSSEGCDAIKNGVLVVSPLSFSRGPLEGRIEHGSRGQAKVARHTHVSLASAH